MQEITKQKLTYKAGADYCTVLGVTDTLTIKGCLDAAEKYGKKVFVDMICVKDIEGRVAEIEEAGVNCIGVHVGVDLQAAGVTPMDDLKTHQSSKQTFYDLRGRRNQCKYGR